MSARARIKSYSVPALERGLRVLELFDRHRTDISAPEVVRELRLPRSTVFRLLRTLEFLGYVKRIEKRGAYTIGPAVLRLWLRVSWRKRRRP